MNRSDKQTPASPTPGAETSRADGIAGLAKMSTTAGLGHEYRAVSAVAVTALSVAVVGIVAVFINVLVVLPLVAVVLAVVALVRIKQSGGTLTGIGLSALAILVGGATLAYAGSAVIGAYNQERADVAAIETTVATLSASLSADDYTAAYETTADPFRERISLELWTTAFSGMQTRFGDLTDVSTTGLANFDEDETGIRHAQTQLVFTVADRDRPLTHPATFTSEQGGPWRMLSLTGVFE
ncbi:MAG: hypothetical protein AAF656_01970 [Planctomycetota bacterium]